ncbi:MAG: PQQ-binding-like beta-propeller repeat protein, partial [Candidatus Brocadiia bacterium]
MSRRLVLVLLAVHLAAPAGDQPQWGQRDSRNMVSDETGLPVAFEPGEVGPEGRVDPRTTRGVRWTARLGSETYATPVVAEGRVLVGTNNKHPRDPRHRGDRGVVLCLDEHTGELRWQLVVPKLTSIKNADWHRVGITSPPTVEDGRAWLVSNRGEVLCLDLEGMADGNDGPYREEGRHMAPPGQPPLEVTAHDADIVWLFDMVAELGVRPHNAANGSPLLRGDHLYVCTSNGVEWTHRRPNNPEAPSLVVLEKATGRFLARDDAPVGPNIFHGQWSSPSFGRAGGRELVFFGGGDGWCYAFAPYRPASPRLETVWRFHCDPAGRMPEGRASLWPPDPHGPSTILAMPVFHRGRVYVAAGGDPWHGKDAGALHCIDASGSGDVTDSGRLWSYDALGRCIATVAVGQSLVYVAGHDGRVHCLDATTGEPCWVHAAGRGILASPLLADGKLYVGTRRGELWVFAAGRTKRVLGRTRVDAPISATPVAANGALFVASHRTLYVVEGEDLIGVGKASCLASPPSEP